MKKTILLILLLVAGAVVGSLIASATDGMEALGWLAYSHEFSVSPFTLNLIITKITFGIEFGMSIAQLIMMIVAVAVYPKLKKVVDE